MACLSTIFDFVSPTQRLTIEGGENLIVIISTGIESSSLSLE